MELRADPSRYDPTAQRFLGAAADLIDAFLHGKPDRAAESAKLRKVRFPAPLDWLHVDDIVRLTTESGGTEAACRRAFYRRWPNRDEFLPDAVVYTLLRDFDAPDPRQYLAYLPAVPDMITPMSTMVVGIAEGLLSTLMRHPRSYLMLHLGPLLPRHPKLGASLMPTARALGRVWASLYEHLVTGLDVVMRPEWTFERTSLVMHAMLEGFLLRYRMQAPEGPASRWEGTAVFADAIIAFMIGAVDWDLTGQSGRIALDTLVRPSLRPARV